MGLERGEAGSRRNTPGTKLQRPQETGREPETLRGGAGHWDREEQSLWETGRDVKVGREAELGESERERERESMRHPDEVRSCIGAPFPLGLSFLICEMGIPEHPSPCCPPMPGKDEFSHVEV